MNPVSRKRYYRSLSPLITAEEMARGLELPALFGRVAPVELEIGFGNGEFLNRESLARPERDFLGIEIAWPSVKRALRRLGNPPRKNARLLCLPAWPALSRTIPQKSLALVRSLYPVPWPRNEGKRLFSKAFLSLVASRLEDGGSFHMVTDDPPLAEWALAQSEGSGLALSLKEEGAIQNTKYERKWESSGIESFLHLSGPKAFHPDIPEPKAPPMKPLYLTGLEPSTYRPKGISGPTSVVFRELVFDGNAGEGLLNCKVVEDSFVQEFFIRLRRTEKPDVWKLYPALSERVFPTEGVQLALRLAALEDVSVPEAGGSGPGGPGDHAS
ncbi:MAG: hypothetical protein LBF40_08205 [Deltaproteobacteria bacterium]|jgi:tRNA (guanine-N7-)-methyltransferase|nr:hypothetical protein [Deltaproteobacteria bacterium]